MQEAQQQTRPAAASTRWHTFAEWLSRQAGGLPEEAVSQASASDAEEDDLTSETAAAAAPSSSSSSSSSARGAGAALAATAPMTPGQLARHATLAPRLPDCRAETRLTGETASRARQEMTVMLAAPGMPLHQAPVLTAKQASALMSAICEPLLSLPVGRLTRKLSAPTKLQPTEERGVLSLWLLPDDSLSLVWQSAQQLAPEELAAATEGSSEGSGESCSSQASVESGAGAASPSSTQQQQAEQAPQQLRQSCSVAVWEELAHFPALAHLMDDVPGAVQGCAAAPGPPSPPPTWAAGAARLAPADPRRRPSCLPAVVTIHMLRGDASGRSFYIRVRNDVAESNLEAATAAVSDAACLVPQRGSAAGAALEGAGEAEASGAPRMYFWLAGRDLGQAVYSLGRLKSLLKRPPTLAKRSGVPERQLAQLGAWVARADAAAAEQQRAAAAEVQQQQEEQEEEEGQQQVGLPGPVDTAGAAAEPAAGSEPASTPVRAALPASSSSFRSSLSPLLQAPAAGLLLGQHGMPMQGSMAALLPPTPPPACVASPAAATATSSSSGPGDGGGEAGPVACGSSTVSATAAALYQDHRFNLVCPCTIRWVGGEGAPAGCRMQRTLLPACLPASVPTPSQPASPPPYTQRGGGHEGAGGRRRPCSTAGRGVGARARGGRAAS